MLDAVMIALLFLSALCVLIVLADEKFNPMFIPMS